VFASKAKVNLWVECGDDYYYGRNGERVDYEMALHFYRKAADKKHPRAIEMLEKTQKRFSGDDDPVFADANDIEYSPNLARFFQKMGENQEFWLWEVAKGQETMQLLHQLSLPTKNEPLTYGEIKRALHDKRDNGYMDSDDFAALAIALLLIKTKRGTAALFDRDIVRAYLTDFLPNVREMRLLSALVFDTDAISYLWSEPQKAFGMLRKQGVTPAEAEQLIDCFVAAFAVRVDYNELSNEALGATADYGDTDAMYTLAFRYYEGKGPTDDDDNEQHYFGYLHRAADAGHDLAVAQLELAAFSGYNDEYKK